MAKKYEINAEKMEELQSARKKNRDKNIDRRLQALILYGEGHSGRTRDGRILFSDYALLQHSMHERISGASVCVVS